MSLRRTNSLTVGRNRKPLLVAGFDDLQQIIPAKPCPRRIALLDEFVNADPTLCVKHQADGVGLMAQDEAQELAEFDRITRHHCPLA